MDIKETNRLLNYCVFENSLYECGFKNIAGVDEAGRGCLAGPLVAAAVIMDQKSLLIERLNDSKKLTPLQRTILFDEIISRSICWSAAAVRPNQIDEINIGRANLLALKRASEKLKVQPDIILSDFFQFESSVDVIPLTGGDRLSISIAAASVVAKVIRDTIMVKMDQLYPEYDFKKNKGYATRDHLLRLQKYGPCPIHRMSFSGVLT
ncbi:MAG: ribonuclease HII [Actinomycetota bacterium]|nr:ribonuclease HII [Actinomycetota bacterium]